MYIKNRIKMPYPIATIAVALLLSLSVSHAATQVDVMALYTQAAANKYAGDPSTRINHMLEVANSAYLASSVDVSLRLVHSERYDNHDGTGVSEQNLDTIRYDQQVASLRRTHGADLVTLLDTRSSTGGGSYLCGIGFLLQGNNGQFYRGMNDWAYSVVGIDCSATTLAHELGHNMSLGHSRLQGSVGGVFDYGVGYGVDSLFATIMTYPHIFSAPAINKFSNPNILCANIPCGIDTNQADSANAALALQNVATQVAGFTATVYTDEALNPPNPEILANNSSGAITVQSGDFTQIVASLSPGYRDGMMTDWWISFETGFGTFWYSQDQGWSQSTTPVLGDEAALQTFTKTLLSGNWRLPGTYTINFWVDDNNDQLFDGTYHSATTITILP